MRVFITPDRVELGEGNEVELHVTVHNTGTLIGGYHLRVLATHGLVEPDDSGDGRSRPWRATPTGFSIDAGDPDAEVGAGRLLAAVGVLWAAFTVSFVVLYLLPGDPVATMASGGLDGEPLPPEELDALRARYGLDQPVLVQYGQRLLAAVTGDFGTSIQNKEVDELFDDARNFVRQSPGIALGAAAALGFLLVRVVKSGLPADTSADTTEAIPRRAAIAPWRQSRVPLAIRARSDSCGSTQSSG